MRIGIFADSHDHLDHLRAAVAEFNRRECQLVLFAGDFVSTFAIPPLRKLNCRLLASFGDNEGNKLGICGGMQIIGEVGEPPFGVRGDFRVFLKLPEKGAGRIAPERYGRRRVGQAVLRVGRVPVKESQTSRSYHPRP